MTRDQLKFCLRERLKVETSPVKLHGANGNYFVVHTGKGGHQTSFSLAETLAAALDTIERLEAAVAANG